MKKLIIILTIGIFLFTGCSNKEESMYKEVDEVTNYVKITMENDDEIVMVLYPDVAPITVENFKNLVSEKFYDGLIFHRVINGFMIQTGDPLGNGTGGSEKTIKGEFSINGVDNNLSHTRGIVSMARKGPRYGEEETSDTMDSASSQFFIVQEDSTYLDGMYAAFGEIVEGISIVDKIAKVKTDDNDLPLNKQKIKTVRFVNKESN